MLRSTVGRKEEKLTSGFNSLTSSVATETSPRLTARVMTILLSMLSKSMGVASPASLEKFSAASLNPSVKR